MSNGKQYPQDEHPDWEKLAGKMQDPAPQGSGDNIAEAQAKQTVDALIERMRGNTTASASASAIPSQGGSVSPEEPLDLHLDPPVGSGGGTPPSQPPQPPSGGGGSGGGPRRSQQEIVNEYVLPWKPVMLIVMSMLGMSAVLYFVHMEAGDPPEVKLARAVSTQRQYESEKKAEERKIEEEKTKQMKLQQGAGGGTQHYPPTPNLQQQSGGAQFTVTAEMQQRGDSNIPTHYRSYEYEANPGSPLMFRSGLRRPKSFGGLFTITDRSGRIICQSVDPARGDTYATDGCAKFLQTAPLEFNLYHATEKSIFINYE